MKKLLVILLSFVVLFSVSLPSFAVSGDITGNIYATDIRTCINGVWVDSFNIGGKTVVVVEDITNQFRYYDDLRMLIIDDFAPEYLIEGKNENTRIPGEIIGNIYETDIKTYYRGKELTAYSLNGKMAVVVEDFGFDNTFSGIGGKYIWNPDNRTLSLETMHRYPYSMRNMLEDKGYNIQLTQSGNTLVANPVPEPLYGGQIFCEMEIPHNSIIPVVYKNEIIGYRCSFSQIFVEMDDSGNISYKEAQSPVDYFYVNKVEDMIFQAGAVTPTVDDWLNYFEQHTVSTIKDRFETEEYLFLYMFSSYIMNGSDRLIKINKADGTKIEYQDMLGYESYKKFENVVIDKENEKVYIEYNDGYAIDLKTDKIRISHLIETDIGAASTDGEPSRYHSLCAKNDQWEYKLMCGGQEKIVTGFATPEFYYATMLPMAEVFEFFNIDYSFENDILTIDTANAVPIAYEETETKVYIREEYPVSYLYVEKVLINGEESKITFPYVSGHFDNTHYGRAEAKPYICNGKVYINANFITHLFEEE